MGKPLQDLSKKINIANSLPSLLEDKKLVKTHLTTTT